MDVSKTIWTNDQDTHSSAERLRPLRPHKL